MYEANRSLLWERDRFFTVRLKEATIRAPAAYQVTEEAVGREDDHQWVTGRGNLSKVVVREIPFFPYEYCVRMIVRDDLLVIFIDGTGRFEVVVSEVQLYTGWAGSFRILMEGETAGEMYLSETGEGIWKRY